MWELLIWCGIRYQKWCYNHYHIQPSFCQRTSSILGHGTCPWSIFLCQVLNERYTSLRSCRVQEERLPCHHKWQVVGKHLHGLLQMAFSNKTPEGKKKGYDHSIWQKCDKHDLPQIKKQLDANLFKTQCSLTLLCSVGILRPWESKLKVYHQM